MLRHMLRPKEDCILVDASSISDYSNTWHFDPTSNSGCSCWPSWWYRYIYRWTRRRGLLKGSRTSNTLTLTPPKRRWLIGMDVLSRAGWSISCLRRLNERTKLMSSSWRSCPWRNNRRSSGNEKQPIQFSIGTPFTWTKMPLSPA